MVWYRYLQKRFSSFYLILTAVALFLLKIPFVLNDPIFEGDSGFRMYNAGNLIFKAGNRVWLPFLQLHIWILYKLKLPYWAFKLIPCLYFLLAVIFLGLLSYRILGKNRCGLIFSIFLMFCFAYQRSVIFLSVNLYQEILEIAFLYILFYTGVFDLRRKIFLLIIASFALLTRDTFQFYLSVLTLLNYKKILSDKKYIFSFIWLWMIPLLWSISVPVMSLIQKKGWPKWPLEWPLMENAYSLAIFDLLTNSKSLITSMIANKIHFFIIGLVIAWIAHISYFRNGRKKICPSDAFEDKFKIFSIVSLAIFYSLVLLIDPWHCGYGHIRMSTVLLSQLFIWCILFYKRTFDYPGPLKFFVTAVLVLSLCLTIFGNTKDWFVKDYSELKIIYAKMEQLKKGVYSPRSCIMEDWNAVAAIVPFTLYKEWVFVPIGSECYAGDCDIIIKPANSKSENVKLPRYAEFSFREKSYVIYSKRIAQ